MPIRRFTISLQSGTKETFPIFCYMKIRLTWIFLLSACLFLKAQAKDYTPGNSYRDSVLSRIYTYASTVDTSQLNHYESYTYTKFQLRTDKRNLALLCVPTMYSVAHGIGRQFLCELYSKSAFHRYGKYENTRLLNTSTIPHRRNTMPSMLKYMTPEIYNPTMMNNNILSPFHRENKIFYRYFISPLAFGRAQVFAYPKIANTQLVTTKAIVDAATGRVELVDFDGEYDMTRFYITVKMGEKGMKSLLAQQCEMKVNFNFMGNRLRADYIAVYDLPKIISDTLDNKPDTALMALVRPIELTDEEKGIYRDFFHRRQERDSINQSTPRKTNFAKDILWDMIGDNVLNRVKQNFGKQDQGYVRINPILNPLYMGYSKRKGFVYKFDIRGSYNFSDNMAFALRFQSGYSFRQKQFYFNIPATFWYNRKHNGFLQVEFGNGNRITTNRVARHILGIQEPGDSIGIVPGKENILDFKDNYLRLTNHWNFHSRWGLEVGLITHHRKAVNPSFYTDHGYPASYRSVAPAIGLEWQPWGRKGPFVKIDYERSYKKLFSSNTSYERWEFDVQGIIPARWQRFVSARFGTGFYTKKGDHWYFVDYTNFRDNNLPGGWNDDWSGDFELLNSGWYNSSDYYVRSNVTYEAPFLLAALLPKVGRFIEKERLYVNTLFVNHLHPYTEWGYGFTTRILSIGMFAAFQEFTFDGVGCRFGFELFRDW